MALIVCPECGRDVSDKAVVCPHCGYPIGQKDERGRVKVGADNDASTQNSSCEVTSNTKKKKSRVRIIVVIFAIFLIFKGVSDLLSSVKKPTNSTPTISKQEIINNAVSLEYNDLIRFSDANEGKYVRKLQVQVGHSHSRNLVPNPSVTVGAAGFYRERGCRNRQVA